jgi:archaellum biogenesis ATPase FlaH
MLSLLKNDLIKNNTVIAQLDGLLMKDESLKLPASICYISFSQSKEDLLRELKRSFPPDFAGSLNSMVFKEFSKKGFYNPKIEVENNCLFVNEGEEILHLLKELISTLEFRAPDSLVIIDSLTSLMRACCFDWRNVIRFLEYIQKRSKSWDGLVYLLQGKGILENTKEEEVMDLVDGVLEFDWVQDRFLRQQAIHMKKFTGLMPNLAKDNIVRFDTMVTNTDGFMVINVKHISGRQ